MNWRTILAAVCPPQSSTAEFAEYAEFRGVGISAYCADIAHKGVAETCASATPHDLVAAYADMARRGAAAYAQWLRTEDAFEELAAVLEFDEGLSRQPAEAAARERLASIGGGES